MKTKTYTREDFSHPITTGIEQVLPMELPFVEFKRGQYEFELDGNKFKLSESTYGKQLHNSRGGMYFQDQKCWSIELVEGEDVYDIACSGSEFTSTKKKVADSINYKIKSYVYKVAKEKGVKPIESFEIKDFEEDFKERDDEDKVKILQRQVEAMSMGMSKWDAFADAYGYQKIEGRYVDKGIMSKRHNAAISAAIRRSSSRD